VKAKEALAAITTMKWVSTGLLLSELPASRSNLPMAKIRKIPSSAVTVTESLSAQS
jgi:hypothetical protein